MSNMIKMEDGTIRYTLEDQHFERLKHWHYHGKVEDTERFKLLNQKTKELAEMVMFLTPICANQSKALSSLELVRMQANAAIAVDECIARGGKCGE